MPAKLICKENINQLPDEKSVVIYNAIPHCGSATVSSILASSIKYCNNFYPYINMPLGVYYSQCISGHGAYNVHMLLPKSITAWYFAFLRHPLSCAISNFKFMQNFLYTEQRSDAMYRQLMGWNGWLTRFLGDGDIELARDTLFHQYAFYGITEYFEESLQRLSALLPSIQNKPYTNLAVSPQKTPEIPSSVIEWFYEQNREDIELYEEAVRRFSPCREIPSTCRDTSYTEQSKHVTELLSQHAPDVPSQIKTEVGDPYQTANILVQHGYYRQALESLEGDPHAVFLPLRIEIYARMGYHLHVLELGSACIRQMEAMDPAGYVPDMKYSIGNILCFVVKAFRALYPDRPLPEEFGRWLGFCGDRQSILPLLSWCCGSEEGEKDLDWFLEHSGPERQSLPTERANAWTILADRHLRQGNYAKARAAAREALRSCPHWPGAVLSLAQSELALKGELTYLSYLERIFPIAKYFDCWERLYDICLKSIMAAQKLYTHTHIFLKWARNEELKAYCGERIKGYTEIDPSSISGNKVIVLCEGDLDHTLMLEDLFSLPGMERENCVCCYSGDGLRTPDRGTRLFDGYLNVARPLLAEEELGRQGLPSRYAALVHVGFTLPDPEGPEALVAALLTGRPPLCLFFANFLMQHGRLLQKGDWRPVRRVRRVAVWGCGGRYRAMVAPQLRQSSNTGMISYFIDSGAEPGRMFEGLPVYSPEEAVQHPVDAVLVASCFREPIADKAQAVGITRMYWI